MRDGPAIILRSRRTVVKAYRSFRDDHHVVELYVGGCAKEISRRGGRSSTRIANDGAPRRVLLSEERTRWRRKMIQKYPPRAQLARRKGNYGRI
jgi:hypothetical protein